MIVTLHDCLGGVCAEDREERAALQAGTERREAEVGHKGAWASCAAACIHVAPRGVSVSRKETGAVEENRSLLV